jgi:hypothetical protein
VAFAQAGFRRTLEREQSGFVIEPLEQATAHTGAERRSPYMDLDLIEKIFQLPPRIFSAGKVWRAQQRQIAMGLIPESVRHRTDKTIFDAVFVSPVEQFLAVGRSDRYSLVERSILDPQVPVLTHEKPSNPELTGFLRLIFVPYELYSHRFRDRR